MHVYKNHVSFHHLRNNVCPWDSVFPSHLTSCSFSLSVFQKINHKNTKIKIKKTVRQKIPKWNIKFKTKFYGVCFVLTNSCWYGVCPGVWLIYQWHSIGKKKWFFFFELVSIANRLLITGWKPISISSSQCWDPICLEPVQIYFHRLSFKSTSVPLSFAKHFGSLFGHKCTVSYKKT